MPHTSAVASRVCPAFSAAIRAAASFRNSSYTSGSRSASAWQSPAAAAPMRWVISDMITEYTACAATCTRRRAGALKVTGC